MFWEVRTPNGIGIGVFKVHPLIMTLGMSLVVLGLTSVYQLAMVQSGTRIPEPILWLGSGISFGFIPNSILVFVPVGLLIVVGLRRTGFGRLLFAVGDNPIAARLSGARVWQVLVALYILSAILASVAGILLAVAVTRRSPGTCRGRSGCLRTSTRTGQQG